MPAQVQGRRNAEDIVQSFKKLETINCKHYPIPFIPGFSRIREPWQDKQTNDEEYFQSQRQRALERDLRSARRDLMAQKQRGLPDEQLEKYKDKVDKANDALDAFSDETGRARRKSREYTPIKATWPDEGE